MLLTSFAQFSRSEVRRLNKIREDLTITNPDWATWSRFGNIFAEEPEKALCFCLEDGDKISVPRNYPFLDSVQDLFVPGWESSMDDLVHEKPLNIKFKGALRPYQKEFDDRVDWEQYNDMLHVQPCGHGKTVWGVWSTAKRKVTTLVMVPTYTIADQWVTAFANFATLGGRGSIGKVKLATADNLEHILEDLPGVLILTYDLYSERLRAIKQSGFPCHWGHVILDEAHRVGAPTYQPVLSLVPSKYRLALTATFRRGDGMDKILRYHFGEMVVMQNQFPKPICYPVKTGTQIDILYNLKSIRGGKKNHEKFRAMFMRTLPKLDIDYRVLPNDILTLDLTTALVVVKKDKWGLNADDYILFKKILTDIKEFTEKYALSLVETYIATLVPRNRKLLTIVRECIEAGRTVLFLSKRKDALKKFHKLFLELGYKSGLVVSETSKDPDNMRFCREEAQVVWGIFQIAKEGMDIDSLDTLVLHHWISDLEQPAGRVARIKQGKKRPMIVYPYDEYNPGKFIYNKASRMKKAVDFMTPVTMDELRSQIW